MKISRLALTVSIIALLVLLAGGPGYRLGLWDLRFGLLDISRYALYLGAAGALLGIVFLAIPATRRNRVAGLIAAVVIGIGVAAVPLQVRNIAESVPPIHDITTDTDNPPQFEAVLPLRADAPNDAEYAGEEIAQQQRQAYPEVQALETSLTPDELFGPALQSARDQGWEIVAADSDEGRIEATATTFWYGFKDDIVVRIQSRNGSSRVDVRSKSRIGQSDLGANAERIRNYLETLERRLEDG